MAPSVKLHVTPSSELNASCTLSSERHHSRDQGFITSSNMVKSEHRHVCGPEVRRSLEVWASAACTVIMWARRRIDTCARREALLSNRLFHGLLAGCNMHTLLAQPNGRWPSMQEV
jgi:hypothetical protein